MILRDDPRSGRHRVAKAMATAGAILVAIVLLLAYRWHLDRQALLDDIAVQAALVGATASAALVFEDRATTAEIVGTLSRSPDVLEAALYGEDGAQLARFLRAGIDGRLPAATPAPGHAFSGRELELTAPVLAHDRPVGAIAIRADMARVYQELAHFGMGLAAISAFALLVGFVASLHARRKIAAAEKALEEMALHDRVSKLANRHAFELALEQAVRRHARVGGGSSLLFIDLDGFKKVNDLLGHHRGDRLLYEVGARLRETLRGADAVARIGGDEYAAILSDTAQPDDAARVADNLIRAVARPFAIDGMPVHVGCSIGIALIPRDGADVETLMQRADLAMYQAKQAGKGMRMFFSEEIGEQVRRQLELEADLRRALAEGQLYLVYQPQVAARDGRIVGLEALVRWRHPERGTISPVEFIPVAEESGLIVELGRTVARGICRDVTRLRREGCVVPRVAMNVSSRQFLMGNLAGELPALLASCGLCVADIELELTESTLMNRVEGRRDCLDELAAMRFSIAIDDFGTGYSSLSYLRSMPVDTLKIDMSFVKGLPDDKESLAIVAGILGMAHAVGLAVVAEGVETAEQLDCLRGLGCDTIQGYYTGRPMEVDALREVLLAAAGRA